MTDSTQPADEQTQIPAETPDSTTAPTEETTDAAEQDGPESDLAGEDAAATGQ